MKLIAILRVKNARQTIRPCLKKLTKLCDAIVIVDNGSTDATTRYYSLFPKLLKIAHTIGFDESRDRNLALHLAKKHNPDWLLWLDADEIFETALTRQRLERYMSQPNLSQVNFRLFHFWLSKTKYRVDGVWGDYTARPQRMMFRNQPTAKFSSKKFHGGGIVGVTGKQITSAFRLKHLGFITKTQIKQKDLLYRRLAKSCPHQASKNLNLDTGTKPRLLIWRDFDATVTGYINRLIDKLSWDLRLFFLNTDSNLRQKVSQIYHSPPFRQLELTLTLSWKLVSSKYKQSILGILWTILQPVSLMLVFVVMSLILKLESTDVPYPIFVYSGLLPWLFFNQAVKTTASSLVDNASIIKKSHLNLKVFPASALVAASFDFFVSFLFLVFLMLIFQINFHPIMLILPAVIAIEAILIFGLGLVLASISIFKRDLLFTLPFTFSLLLYITPTFYPLSSVPANLRNLYLLNPLAVIVDSFRQILIFHQLPNFTTLLYTLTISVVFFAIGLKLFNRLQKYAGDLL